MTRNLFMSVLRRTLLALALAMVSSVGAMTGAVRAEVAAPDGYRLDRYRAPTPAALPGAGTVDPAEVAAWMERGVVLIDVMPASVTRLAPDPAGTGAPGGWILDQPHHNIPRSVWLPNVGQGTLPPDVDTWYRGWLDRLTGGDPARPVILYCKADCWLSWNAGKRAVSYGYTAVLWFRDGVDGWTESGRPLVEARPAGPPPTR